MSRTFATGDPAPQPLRAPTEAAIVADWSDGYSTEPVVSILCPTYQQAPFVRDAMDGFLAQRTPFPFEVIVGDDGSTDGTAEIVAEYAERYPRIVRAILQQTNSWAQTHPLVQLIPEARGEFIALCEGDDYWIDPNKVATQVRDLNLHPEAVISHHDSVGVSDGKVIWPRRGTSHLRDHDPEALRRGELTKMVSLCFRNVAPDLEHAGRNIRVMFDRFLGCVLAEHGGSVLTTDVLPAVYRVHQAGMWTGLGPRERAETIATERYWIAMHFAGDGRPDTAAHHLFVGIASLLAPDAGGHRDASVAAASLRNFLSHYTTTELLQVVLQRVVSRIRAILPKPLIRSGGGRILGSYTRRIRTKSDVFDAPRGPIAQE